MGFGGWAHVTHGPRALLRKWRARNILRETPALLMALLKGTLVRVSISPGIPLILTARKSFF